MKLSNKVVDFLKFTTFLKLIDTDKSNIYKIKTLIF